MPNDAPAEINVELIQQLCLEAGRIMEDVSADMALALPRFNDGIRTRVELLHRAADDIIALANAAQVLVR